MANPQTTATATIIPIAPAARKAKARSKAKARTPRKPRRDIVKNVQNVIAMRDELKAVAAERRAIADQIRAERRELKWGGLRSIALLALMSSALVGMLVAGVLG